MEIIYRSKYMSRHVHTFESQHKVLNYHKLMMDVIIDTK